MTTANHAYWSVNKAAEQASGVAEANFLSLSNTAVKATQTATKADKRAA